MKKKFCALTLLSLLVLAGCGGSEPIPHGIDNDSGLPTKIEKLGEPGIQIHYQRASDGSYKDWALWLWAEGKDGAEYTFNYQDEYGVLAYYPLSYFGNPKSLGFIVKTYSQTVGGDMWGDKVVKDCSSDRFMDIDMLKMDKNKVYHCYLLNGSKNVYTDPQRTKLMNAVVTCEFTSSKKISLVTNNSIAKPEIYKNGELISASITGSKTKWTISLSEAADISDSYQVKATFPDSSVLKDVSIRNLYDEEFDNKYNYDGELGAIYTTSSTTFKVWTPISKQVKLRIYDNGTPKSVSSELGNDKHQDYDMTKNEKGVFSCTVNGDLQGKYYTYVVYNSYHKDGQEVVDPYAKSAGVNGLRGMVVDFSRTNPTGWDAVSAHNYDRKSLVVYETHVADVTSSATWTGTEANRKKFAGMHEAGTKYTENGVTVTTGFDHIKELGVNAVQIIPFFDQANDEVNVKFNWGYNPLNYNVVEGAYSSNPYDGYTRIRELKALIKAYNEAGINIIMDVVYNHVAGLTGSNFDVLMPFYYFRYTDTGGASSGSGCGNDTASERYMFRRFMIDSASFWAKEYKLGGFRFDLMGLHDLETMNKLVKEVEKVNPNIVIYGEPWLMGTAVKPGTVMADQNNVNSYYHMSQFNDYMRDALIKSGMNKLGDRGWVNQEKYGTSTNYVVYGLLGMTGTLTADPDKSISYASCHDNYTLHDRILMSGVRGDDEIIAKARETGEEVNIYGQTYNLDEKLAKMNVLANSLVLTSQGISFLLAGEEMLRTKIIYDENGNTSPAKDEDGNELDFAAVSGNSYESSYKTNEIDYSLKIKHLDMMENYKALINFKKTFAGLHFKQSQVSGFVRYETYMGDEETLANKQSIIHQSIEARDGYIYHFYYANGSLSADYTIDVTGATLIHDTLGRTFAGNSHTLARFETLIYKVPVQE